MADEEQTGGSGLGRRRVSLKRVRKGVLELSNERGGTMLVGQGEEPGDDANFTPVELLLAAIAGCSANDVDYIAGKRAEPTAFDVVSEGLKVKDEHGNHLDDIEVTFTVRFPEGEAGDRARDMLPKAIAMSHDRLCTVTRTVVLGTPVASHEG
jgi:uncharacterized OsmC-like protein